MAHFMPGGSWREPTRTGGGVPITIGLVNNMPDAALKFTELQVRDLLARADAALSIFGAKGDVLRAAARFVAERKN